jgi:hypothetical protein
MAQKDGQLFMNQGNSIVRSPHLTSLYHLEGLLYTSLRITKGGQEAVHLMQEAIGRLPLEYRLVFILSYLEGSPQEEIADLAGVEPQDVASMLQQGRELIEKEYFKRTPDSETRSMTINRISETIIDWIDTEVGNSHACGQTICCKRHHAVGVE